MVHSAEREGGGGYRGREGEVGIGGEKGRWV